MNKAVGIIGLGKMGLPIAANLLEHGFTVIGRHSLEQVGAYMLDLRRQQVEQYNGKKPPEYLRS